jgi:hypothetical protein
MYAASQSTHSGMLANIQDCQVLIACGSGRANISGSNRK